MNYHRYVLENKNDLLRIYGEIRLGREMEIVINPDYNLQEFEIDCCLDTIIVYKNNFGIVDFPILKPKYAKMIKEKKLSHSLYAMILCEEGVKKGFLKKSGSKYSHAKISNKKNMPKYNNYFLVDN